MKACDKKGHTLFFLFNKRHQADGLLGVALTADGAALACLRQTEGRSPELLACEYLQNASAEALGQQCRGLKLDKRKVAAVMAAGEFALQLLEAPQVEAEEMRSAIRWQLKDTLDYSIDEAVVDVFEIPGLKQQGRTPMVYAVSAAKSNVKKHIDVFDAAGLELCYVDIPELAQRNIARLLPEDDTGVALLRLSEKEGLLTLTQQSNLYLSRGLDVGLGVLSAPAAIAANAGADNLSLAGIAPDAQRGLDAIVLEVQRSLDYYESHFGKPPIGNLFIAPMESEATDIVDYLNNSLGLKVQTLDLNTVLETSAAVPQAMQARCFNAIGAALRVETES